MSVLFGEMIILHDGEMVVIVALKFLWVYDLSSNIRGNTINSNTNHFIQEEHHMYSGFIC